MSLTILSENTSISRYTNYPKVLICCISRINKNDTFNNNLLLRNLFAEWPRERLAQVYSGGGNGDQGFCDHQYKIGSHDRRFGSIFLKLKGEYSDSSHSVFSVEPDDTGSKQSIYSSLKHKVGCFLIDSGIYELLFKVRLSKEIVDWVKEFDPDIIFAQGYNLTFTWLPLLLKWKFNKPIAFYNSDDWPSYLYTYKDGFCAITSPIMRRIVNHSTQQLLAATDLPFSFNALMGEDYKRRYSKSFTTLRHCDDPERFRRAEPIRLHPLGVISIIAAGIFDESRWPQLLDLDEACQRLNQEGVQVQTTVLATRITETGYSNVKKCKFVALNDDPGHELLPSYLKGADLLFLPETFNSDDAHGYKYSISTKAHLFMFSQRPILVYGHPASGLLTSASNEGWAHVVNKRNVDLLEAALRELIVDSDYRKNLVSTATSIVMTNNDCNSIRKIFLNGMRSIQFKQRETL